MNGFIEKFRLKITLSVIVNSFIIIDERFKAILYTKRYCFWFVYGAFAPCLMFEALVSKLWFLIHCNWTGEKQESFNLSSTEVDTSNGFRNAWRWLNNDWILILRELLLYTFLQSTKAKILLWRSSSDESERNNVVLVSIKTTNRCPHAITHLREVTFNMQFHHISISQAEETLKGCFTFTLYNSQLFSWFLDVKFTILRSHIQAVTYIMWL